MILGRFSLSRFTGCRSCSIRQLHSSIGAPPSKLAFAFDIDGVLKQGPTVLDQARRALDILAGNNQWKRKIPYLLITNGGGVPDEDRRAILSRELGHELTSDQLVQSHTPLRALAKHFSGSDKHVLIIGGRGDSCRRVAHSYGMANAWIPQDIIAWKQSVWPKTTLSDADRKIVIDQDFSKISFSAILCMHDSHDWGRDATILTELLDSQDGYLGTVATDATCSSMPLFFTNPDLIWKSDYILPRYGQGAFRIAVQAIYKETTGKGLAWTQLGKPHKATYDFAQEMLERHLRSLGGTEKEIKEMNVYMVGDNPASDIAGANAHGWSSILLRTGVYQDGTEPAHKPTVIVDDVEKAVEWAIERESLTGEADGRALE